MVSTGLDDDVAAWRAIFTDSDPAFCVLTDEELAAVYPVQEASASPQPWLRGRDDLTADAAAAVGARSLAVRGLMTVEGDQPRVDPALRLAVQARDLACEAWTVSDIDTDEALRVSRLADLGVVIETVTGDGFHAYAAAHRSKVVSEIVQWSLGWRRSSTYRIGPSRIVAAAEWDAFVRREFDQAQFGSAVRRLDIEWWPPGVESSTSWALVIDDVLAVVCRPMEAEHLAVQTVDADLLANLLRDQLI